MHSQLKNLGVLYSGTKSVSDYITRLEWSFQFAYGCEHLSNETRDAFLFSQLQAGLKLILIESPAVSGPVSYKQLCITAKQEEKRQIELKRIKQQQDKQFKAQSSRQVSGNRSSSQPISNSSADPRPPSECYICGKTNHLAKQCKQRKSESSAVETKQPKKVSAVTSMPSAAPKVRTDDPMEFLDSDSDGSVSVYVSQIMEVTFAECRLI